VLDRPFAGDVDLGWLVDALGDRSPDVLAAAMEFLAGEPDRRDPAGVLVAADASYGPLRDETRDVGSDWNDFQGVTAAYGDDVDPPEPDEARSLDCSGFVRMVFGRRFGVPLGLEPDGGRSLPRRSADQAVEAPGVVLVAEPGGGAALDRLQPGDLVFFDADDDDGAGVDHVGIYLGLDAGGHHRFVSSRRSADGPTSGDVDGPSLLDGAGLYARSFRSSRRL
jgi:NlpC/P60 family